MTRKIQIINIGIDPSINSTGVCVNIIYDDLSKKQEFFIITNNISKKDKIFEDTFKIKNVSFHFILYNKLHIEGTYQEKEYKKLLNFSMICDALSIIVKKYKKYNININMEGISYGSKHTLSVFDLAGLNYMIRNIFKKYNINIIAPTENKKLATGKGNANKDMIVQLFISIFPEFGMLKKNDDIADAYFLSEW